jgi:hypothetical protein
MDMIIVMASGECKYEQYVCLGGFDNLMVWWFGGLVNWCGGEEVRINHMAMFQPNGLSH